MNTPLQTLCRHCGGDIQNAVIACSGCGRLIKEGAASGDSQWVLFNATEVADALDNALDAEDGFAYIIDIHACRKAVTPLP